MRRLDDTPIDPEIAASLDAIDATLAGEPVDPKYADLAELALLLSTDRPQCSDEFARTMDERVARRFAPAPTATAGGTGHGGRRRRSFWSLAPVWGSAVAGLAIAVMVVVNLGGGTTSNSSSSAASFNASPPLTTTSASTASSSAGSVAGGTALLSVPAPPRSLKHAAANGTATRSPAPIAAAPVVSAASGSTPATAPTPPANGRKIIQSAQLALNAPPTRIDAVAQQVFNVVGAQSGFVNRSSVTAANNPGAYAEFQLSIPSQNLSQTMAQLSKLRYASVSSRTDNTQDVNNQSVGDNRAVDEDKAKRTALLKQLANAVTTQQIDSITAQIHDINAKLAADESTLNSLNHAIAYSRIQLTINAASALPATHHHSGFTLGKAAHDAGRVLTVAAGVALITLAAAVPIALLAALAWWIASVARRRRREQALDLA
jgi:hypothetical protein